MKFRIIIDCPEKIPCNPCETVCPRGKIVVGKDISQVPVITVAECAGCGRCIAVCPGLAIRMIGLNEQESEKQSAHLYFPHEYLPLPVKGEIVHLVDKMGKIIGSGTVLKVLTPIRNDLTAVIAVRTDSATAEKASGISTGSEDEGISLLEYHFPDSCPDDYESNRKKIICRCENIPLSEIHAAIEAGARSLDEIKKRTRSSMGLCGGKNCSRIIAGILSERSGKKKGAEPAIIISSRIRPPVSPVTVAELASSGLTPQ